MATLLEKFRVLADRVEKRAIDVLPDRMLSKAAVRLKHGLWAIKDFQNFLAITSPVKLGPEKSREVLVIGDEFSLSAYKSSVISLYTVVQEIEGQRHDKCFWFMRGAPGLPAEISDALRTNIDRTMQAALKVDIALRERLEGALGVLYSKAKTPDRLPDQQESEIVDLRMDQLRKKERQIRAMALIS